MKSIHEMCRVGDARRLNILLKAGGVTKEEIDAVDEHGRTPLGIACKRGAVSMVELLIAAGANVNAKLSKNVNQSLRFVTTYSTYSATGQLLEKGSAEHSKFRAQLYSPLLIAARAGHVQIIKLLVNSGADITASSYLYDLTALEIAWFEGHVGIVKFILSEILYLSQRRSASVVRLIEGRYLAKGGMCAERKVVRTYNNLGQLLSQSFSSGGPRLFSRFLEAINKEEESRALPKQLIYLFMLALNRESSTNYVLPPVLGVIGLKIVRFLMLPSFFSSFSSYYKDCWNIFFVSACEKGFNYLVSCLLEYSASGKVTIGHSLSGWVARLSLYHAAKNNRLAVLEKLVPAMVSANWRDQSAIQFYINSALHLAAENGHDEVVSLLCGLVSNPGQRHKKQSGLLFRAVYKGFYSVVKNLLVGGVNLSEASSLSFFEFPFPLLSAVDSYHGFNSGFPELKSLVKHERSSGSLIGQNSELSAAWYAGYMEIVVLIAAHIIALGGNNDSDLLKLFSMDLSRQSCAVETQVKSIFLKEELGRYLKFSGFLQKQENERSQLKESLLTWLVCQNRFMNHAIISGKRQGFGLYSHHGKVISSFLFPVSLVGSLSRHYLSVCHLLLCVACKEGHADLANSLLRLNKREQNVMGLKSQSACPGLLVEIALKKPDIKAVVDLILPKPANKVREILTPSFGHAFISQIRDSDVGNVASSIFIYSSDILHDVSSSEVGPLPLLESDENSEDSSDSLMNVD